MVIRGKGKTRKTHVLCFRSRAGAHKEVEFELALEVVAFDVVCQGGWYFSRDLSSEYAVDQTVPTPKEKSIFPVQYYAA
jgi:hypothetical protein